MNLFTAARNINILEWAVVNHDVIARLGCFPHATLLLAARHSRRTGFS
jgi:uncharacterized protein (DUF924 family)